MPDGFVRPAGVAVVPCFNEGRNPLDLARVLLSVPDLDAIFIDDASEGASGEAFDELSRLGPRVRVVRNAVRAGKVASLLRTLRSLDPRVTRVLLVDADVVVPEASLRAVVDELDRADFVLANASAIGRPRTLWERGAIFSARRHDRLRERALARYPALFSNGRLLGMSRRFTETVVRGDVPSHTEDAHFMLVCLTQGFRYAYRADAVLQYRAPETLADYLRQTSRFGSGRALLRERWDPGVLARYYDPKPADLLATLLAQAVRDPIGAAVFAVMLGAKFAGGRTTLRSGTWAVAPSTKALR